MKKIFVTVLLFLLNISISRAADPGICNEIKFELATLQKEQVLMHLPETECLDIDNGKKACTYAELTHLYDEKLSNHLILNGIKKLKNDIATDASKILRENKEKFLEGKPALDKEIKMALGLEAIISQEKFQKLVETGDVGDFNDFRKKVIKELVMEDGIETSNDPMFEQAAAEDPTKFWNIVYRFARNAKKDSQPNWKTWKESISADKIKKLQAELDVIEKDLKNEGSNQTLLLSKRSKLIEMINKEIKVKDVELAKSAKFLSEFTDPENRSQFFSETLEAIDEDHSAHVARLEANSKLQKYSVLASLKKTCITNKARFSDACSTYDSLKKKNKSGDSLVEDLAKLAKQTIPKSVKLQLEQYDQSAKRVKEFDQNKSSEKNKKLVATLNSKFICEVSGKLDQNFEKIKTCLGDKVSEDLLNQKLAKNYVELEKINEAIKKIENTDTFKAAELIKNVSVYHEILVNNDCDLTNKGKSHNFYTPTLTCNGQNIYQKDSSNLKTLHSFNDSLHFHAKAKLSEDIAQSTNEELLKICQSEPVKDHAPIICANIATNKITLNEAEINQKAAEKEKIRQKEEERRQKLANWDPAKANRELAAMNTVNKYYKKQGKKDHEQWMKPYRQHNGMGWGAFMSGFRSSDAVLRRDFGLIDYYANNYAMTSLYMAERQYYPFGRNHLWSGATIHNFMTTGGHEHLYNPEPMRFANATFLDDPGLDYSYFTNVPSAESAYNFSGQNGAQNIYFESFSI